MTSFSEYKRRVDSGQPGLEADTSVPKDARAYQGHRAGFFSRAIAAIIDVVSVIVIVVLMSTPALDWLYAHYSAPANVFVRRMSTLPVAFVGVMTWLFAATIAVPVGLVRGVLSTS